MSLLHCFGNVEGLLKVTTSHVDCKSGNVSEIVQHSYRESLIGNHV